MRPRRSPRFARRLILTTSALLFAALLASPAMAHSKHGHHAKHRNHGHAKHRVYDGHGGHRSYVPRHYRGHRRFTVPTVIVRRDVRRYDDYYRGRMYYEPHGHYHTVYDFPVAVRGGYTLQPYAYCGERLYRDPEVRFGYRGRRVSFSFGY